MAKYDVSADYKKLGFDGLNKKWLIYESEYWIWALRVSIVTLGSSVLALRRPCTDTTKLTQEERDDQHKMHKLIRDIMFEQFGAKRMNYMNLGNADNQVHEHILPRYPVTKEFNGEKFYDRTFGNFPEMSNPDTYSEETLLGLRDFLKEKVAQKLENGVYW